MTVWGRLTLASCQASIQLLSVSALLQDREKTQAALDDICSDYDSLVGKVKSVCTNGTKISTSHQQADVQLVLGKQGFSTCDICLRRQTSEP